MILFLKHLNIALAPPRRAALQEAMRASSNVHGMRFVEVVQWLKQYLVEKDMPSQLYKKYTTDTARGMTRAEFCRVWGEAIVMVRPELPRRGGRGAEGRGRVV